MACGDPGGTKCAGTGIASMAGVMALSEPFFQPHAAGYRPLGQSFSIALPIQTLRGLPCLESFSVVLCVMHIEGPLPPNGVLLCSVVHQSLKRAPRMGPTLCDRCLMGQAVYCSASYESFECLYILFSTGQVLLSTLSWCSACTSVSEGVFLMYPWREMYSTSTCSSTIFQVPFS